MHSECFPKEGLRILNRLNHIVKTHRFVLAGGTAAAIQIGHRISEDLDFFTNQPFPTDEIFRELQRRKLNPLVLQEEKHTLTVTIGQTKVSMFYYPYPFMEKYIKWKNVAVSGITDIAAMKIIAISQRGAKRDFVDLYFILRTIPFWKVSENLIKRFGADRINPVHIGKSLVYFHDADSDPDPRYCRGNEPDWQTIKMFFVGHIQQMVLDLQRAKEPNQPA
jgi:predicted nucleotidyltransferase component of viral defense system